MCLIFLQSVTTFLTLLFCEVHWDNKSLTFYSATVFICSKTLLMCLGINVFLLRYKQLKRCLSRVFQNIGNRICTREVHCFFLTSLHDVLINLLVSSTIYTLWCSNPILLSSAPPFCFSNPKPKPNCSATIINSCAQLSSNYLPHSLQYFSVSCIVIRNTCYKILSFTLLRNITASLRNMYSALLVPVTSKIYEESFLSCFTQGYLVFTTVEVYISNRPLCNFLVASEYLFWRWHCVLLMLKMLIPCSHGHILCP